MLAFSNTDQQRGEPRGAERFELLERFGKVSKELVLVLAIGTQCPQIEKQILETGVTHSRFKRLNNVTWFDSLSTLLIV